MEPSKIAPEKDRHAPSHKMPEETIVLMETHIESFQPAVPHYRDSGDTYPPPPLN